MAPTEELFTTRYFLGYTGGFGRHVTMFRTSLDVTDADATAAIRAFLTPMLSAFGGAVRFDSLARRKPGEAISTPLTFIEMVGTNTAPLQEGVNARFCSFVGRDMYNKKTRVTLFAYAGSVTGNYRLTRSEDAAVHNALDVLQSPNSIFRSKAGQVVFWNEYVNTGHNSYFQRRARRSLA